MVAHILVRFALGDQVQILLDQPLASAQEKGNLTDLHIPLFEVRAAGKRRKVVALSSCAPYYHIRGRGENMMIV